MRRAPNWILQETVEQQPRFVEWITEPEIQERVANGRSHSKVGNDLPKPHRDDRSSFKINASGDNGLLAVECTKICRYQYIYQHKKG